MTYILDALRSPIGKINGQYKSKLPEELLAEVTLSLLKRNNLEAENINEIIIGNANGSGGNLGQNAMLRAFNKHNVSVTTIDAQCTSGLRALYIGSKIKGDLILAGGVESCSLVLEKYYNKKDSRYTKEPIKRAEFDPRTKEQNLEKAAENLAKAYNISKSEMLAWTETSHKRALGHGLLSNFILESTLKDECLKNDFYWAAAQTQSLIDKTNIAREADAAALVILSSKKTENCLGKIVSTFSMGTDPERAQYGLIEITERLIKNAGIKLEDLSAVEINDSYAVNALAFSKHFNFSLEKINKIGGTLAYGHPYGASGTINFIHLLAVLKKGELGLVIVTAAGGQSTAILIQKC